MHLEEGRMVRYHMFLVLPRRSVHVMLSVAINRQCISEPSSYAIGHYTGLLQALFQTLTARHCVAINPSSWSTRLRLLLLLLLLFQVQFLTTGGGKVRFNPNLY